MMAMGSTLNTMTLGGLAVALGVVVDDAVIGTENIVRRLRTKSSRISPRDVILAASVEVRAPVLYATLMLALVLLPVLLLHGLQGSFFSPLAAAFIIATLASLTGATLSLGSLVGFVTLFGVAARNSILLIAHIEQLIAEEGHDWSVKTILLATRERVTPILMTALVTGLGVLPLAISTGQVGREIQGPMAVVILGGLITSTIASLILLPALAWRYGRAPVRS